MPTAITDVLAPGVLRTPRQTPAPKRPDPCADDKPACPACGGLQCLCRPRFFPGQLLTDEDLNRLERYVIDKNKLHNRYLHGWGVACGMEVVCDPCSGTNVVVRTGYALSPCGDDIIVCKDHSVDVCQLIDQCRPQTGVVCDPPAAQSPRECRDGIEPWVLAICYDEKPSRGITALTGSTDSACCSSCSCGGSGSCGCSGSQKSSSSSSGSCGCNGSSKSSSTTGSSKTKKTYKPQCEPTQICEGYRFTAYPMPKPTKAQAPSAGATRNMDLLFAWMYANRAKFGPMLERLLCCVTAALQLRESYSNGKYGSGREALASYSDYLDALRDFASNFALHNCAFLDKLTADTKDTTAQMQGLNNVSSLNESHRMLINTSFLKLDQSVFDLIAECFCSALLPSCPEPAPDNCVPLALLAVRTRDCQVVEICNWQVRKLLITWRTVGYWLSWLPWEQLRTSIAKLCCAGTPRRSVIWPLMIVIGMVLTKSRAAATPRIAFSVRGDLGAAEDATPEAPLKEALASDNLMEHLANGYESLRAGTDAQAPEWASLIARFADGSALAPLAGTEAMKKADLGDIGTALGVAALKKQVDDLKAQLASHEETMVGLRNLMKGKGG